MFPRLRNNSIKKKKITLHLGVTNLLRESKLNPKSKMRPKKELLRNKKFQLKNRNFRK